VFFTIASDLFAVPVDRFFADQSRRMLQVATLINHPIRNYALRGAFDDDGTFVNISNVDHFCFQVTIRRIIRQYHISNSQQVRRRVEITALSDIIVCRAVMPKSEPIGISQNAKVV
jgi:hypothetical protein